VTPTPRRRVVVADDDAGTRDNLRAILEAGGLSVVAEAADGRACLRAIAETRPDAALVDVRMPVLDGLAAVEQLAGERRTALVVLTSFGDPTAVDRALAAGVDGFLLKTGDPRELVRAVHDAIAGGVVLSPTVARHLADRVRADPAPPDLSRLTAREQDVLDLIARGRSNAEIAAELGLTEGTVKGYVSVVLDRLGVRNRVEAALLAHGRHRPG
jgi:DNA-binding NarL/FixJ family response regulator